MKKLVILLLVLLALCGCGSAESRLVGTWEGDGFDFPGLEFEVEAATELVFKQDGTVELMLPNGKSWTCDYYVTDDTLTIREVEGGTSLGIAYKLRGDTLTLNPGGAAASGVYTRK